MEIHLLDKMKLSLDKFINWLANYGETSYDHQSFFASPLGGRAKEALLQKTPVGNSGCSPFHIFAKQLYHLCKTIIFSANAEVPYS